MRWTHIIVHHSAGYDTDETEVDAIRRQHITEKQWRDIGYHRVVERVDGLYQALDARPLYDIGSHAKGWNSRALGVCFIGNFMEGPPPSEQLEVGAVEIAGLCYLTGIPVENIWAHRKVKPTACPGANFPMIELRTRVAELLKTNP